jgi:hypothetical protein
MSRRGIDLQASTVTIRTRATGLLARFAHDLEITAEDFEGSVEVDGDRWSTDILFPVRRLRVVGSLRDGRVDFSAISASDLAEIERKIRDEVLRGPEVKVRVDGASPSQGQLRVSTPEGEQRLSVRLSVSERPDGGHTVAGDAKLSLRKLGVPAIKGPLGAFKVDDEVDVEFEFAVPVGGGEG